MVLIVVMGVSGCGKSSFGQALASKMGLEFIEGDALHPAENVGKMSRGIPLTDEDRWPWLQRIGLTLNDASAHAGAVATCSSLKRSYRDLLRQTAGDDLQFVYLQGSRELLAERMKKRQGHFMPASLLDSQLAALEPPQPDEKVIIVDCAEPLGDAVSRVAEILRDAS